MDFPGKVMILGANYGPLTLSGQWWRLLTYMFLHGGLMHIAFNMWCLWDLGALCESLYGRWTFAAIYLITGIAGGAGQRGVESRRAKRWRIGRDLRTRRSIGRVVLSRRILAAHVAIRGTLRSLVVFVDSTCFSAACFAASTMPATSADWSAA